MTSQIETNAARIKELQQRIHATFALRDESPQKLQEWKDACETFHRSYNSLAFPGGYAEGLEKIKSGNPETISLALDYLEHTPYCFRSQYVATIMRRALNKADLSESESLRFTQWKEKTKERRTSRYRQ
jgi:hypothetical protein